MAERVQIFTSRLVVPPGSSQQICMGRVKKVVARQISVLDEFERWSRTLDFGECDASIELNDCSRHKGEQLVVELDYLSPAGRFRAISVAMYRAGSRTRAMSATTSPSTGEIVSDGSVPV